MTNLRNTADRLATTISNRWSAEAVSDDGNVIVRNVSEQVFNEIRTWWDARENQLVSDGVQVGVLDVNEVEF